MKTIYHVLVNGKQLSAELDENASQIIVNGKSVPFDYADLKGEKSLSILLNNRSFTVDHATSSLENKLSLNGVPIPIEVWDDRTETIRKLTSNKVKPKVNQGDIRAPMPGLVVKMLVSEGQEVHKGQGLVVVEAMKMENEISAPLSGTVKRCLTKTGNAVNKGDVLIIIADKDE